MPRHIRIAVAALCVVALGAHKLAAQDFKVIVNTANPVAELSAEAASKIFLKTVSKFPEGGAAVPVEPAKASPARAAFAKTVLGRTVQNLDTYWQQQIFSGKDVPPANKTTDDEVIAFVKSNPAAIGYVSGAAAVAGVKVVAVK